MYGIHFPLASNPNQPPSPFAGAGEGEMFAFFGGNKGNQGFDPTKKQSRRDTINLINAVNSGDPLYLPPGVTMDQAREFVRNRDNGNLTEKFKLRNFKPNVKKNLAPTCFIFDANNLYVSTNFGKLLIVNIENASTKEILKIGKGKLSRPFVKNQNLFLIKDNAIIKLN